MHWEISRCPECLFYLQRTQRYSLQCENFDQGKKLGQVSFFTSSVVNESQDTSKEMDSPGETKMSTVIQAGS